MRSASSFKFFSGMPKNAGYFLNTNIETRFGSNSHAAATISEMSGSLESSSTGWQSSLGLSLNLMRNFICLEAD